MVLSLEDRAVPLDPADVAIEVGRGSGPGGQHKNKTETLVKVLHRPTGITAKADGRSQHQNKEMALRVLARRVEAARTERQLTEFNDKRTLQMSGDRAFTWTDWRDQVVCHRSGRKAKMSRALKGELGSLV